MYVYDEVGHQITLKPLNDFLLLELGRRQLVSIEVTRILSKRIIAEYMTFPFLT